MSALATTCAVLGDPVAHSLSPTLHRAGYAALGLDWDYTAQRVRSGGLGDFVRNLDATWRGLSLTMPLKREAFPFCSEISALAQQAGAINTITFDSGAAYGDNTDVPGAMAAIRERCTDDVGDVTILGGGATVASTGLAAFDLGARSVRVLARSPERAAATVEVLRAHSGGRPVEVDTLDARPHADALLINTIPTTAQIGAVLEHARAARIVFEVIYDPWPTPVAEANPDAVLVSGLDLLVHQAALQFELFTGHAPPLQAMRAAGEAVLHTRKRS